MGRRCRANGSVREKREREEVKGVEGDEKKRKMVDGKESKRKKERQRITRER